MNKIIFYTTHCPKCKVLKMKLDKAGIDYEENDNVDEMVSMGLQSAPALKVDNVVYEFAPAVQWIKEQINGTN